MESGSKKVAVLALVLGTLVTQGARAATCNNAAGEVCVTDTVTWRSEFPQPLSRRRNRWWNRHLELQSALISFSNGLTGVSDLEARLFELNTPVATHGALLPASTRSC